MGKRLSGQDIEARVGDYRVTFEEVTLNIEDTSKAVMSKGRPNGYVGGTLRASGEIKVDTPNLLILVEAARLSGSWQGLDPFDVVLNGSTVEDGLTVEAFDCLIKVSELVNANANGEDKLAHTLPYEVTGKDFVHINGVPYASEHALEDLR